MSRAALNLTCWTQALLLDGELAAAELKTLRYRLLQRRCTGGAPRPPQHPTPATQLAWAVQLAQAFTRLRALPLRC